MHKLVKMKKILIIMIGKGQFELLPDNLLKYRSANYSAKGQYFETAFVGEAIIRLHPDAGFDKVYILGTKDAMWDTLYAHSVKTNLSEENVQNIQNISAYIRKSPQPEKNLNLIASAFKDLTGVDTTCLTIPVGKDENEIWQFFELLTQIPKLDNEAEIVEVSIDVTHSLRIQPFVLMLALAFLRAARKNISIGSIFYGALELTDDYFQGKYTPLLDLRPLIDLLDWTEATHAFQQYGSIQKLLDIAQKNGASEQFLEDAQNLSWALQLNTSNRLRSFAKPFLNEFKKMLQTASDKMTPLEVIEEDLMYFPQEILAYRSNWEMMIELGAQHFHNGQMALSIIATWEALINRLGSREVYNKQSEKMYNYSVLSAIISDERIAYLGDDFENFAFFASKLKAFRHSVAHSQENHQITLEDIKTFFPVLRQYFHDKIYDSRLQNLPQHINFFQVKEALESRRR